jgi:hypothetical protein
MQEETIIINQFLDLCNQSDKVLNDAIDTLLDSYKNTSAENGLLSEFSAIQNLSDEIRIKTELLNVDNPTESLQMLDYIQTLLDKRNDLVDNLKVNCFQRLLSE